jgi:TDG/mug DNA glycosylase family protein
MSALLQGLAPVVNERTRVLVLGSFPGVRSLALQQYYAHPQNHFWRILHSIWPDAPWPSDDDYAQRCACALAFGVGIWDVYACCEREGSLDTAIRHAQLNDFAALLRRCTALVAIAHNGGESFRHARAVARALSDAGLRERVVIERLPSTSPANASWSFERKLQAWRLFMQEHIR